MDLLVQNFTKSGNETQLIEDKANFDSHVGPLEPFLESAIQVGYVLINIRESKTLSFIFRKKFYQQWK